MTHRFPSAAPLAGACLLVAAMTLPALRSQEAVVVGEGVTLPMRIRFNDLPLEHRPASDTAVFSKAWETEEQPEWDLIYETIERWRHQVR